MSKPALTGVYAPLLLAALSRFRLEVAAVGWGPRHLRSKALIVQN